MSDFEVLTIDPKDIKAGDRVLLGEKAANQPVALADAHVMDIGDHAVVIVPTDHDGRLRLNPRFTVQVRRNKRMH